MKKTLGGDRLGSGNKQDVNLHGWDRSTHDLSTTVATTMGIGMLYPIHHSIVLAGDTREIDLNAMLLTHPTEGPLFGSFKLQVDVFKADMRLYIAKLHMNLLDKGLEMSDIKLPQIIMKADDIDWTKDPSNQQINPSSIFKYLHISGLGGDNEGVGSVTRLFNAIPWLMYWDIFKNYYANKQEENAWVIHNNTETITNNITSATIDNGTPIPLPEYPTVLGADIEENTLVTFNFTGGIAYPENVAININGIQHKIEDIFESVAIGANTIECTLFNLGITAQIDNWQWVAAEPGDTTELAEFPLSNLDEIKMDILADVRNTGAFTIDESTIAPFGIALGQTGGTWAKTVQLEGLALKTYQSDLFNNWLNTEWIDGVNGINARTAIQTDGTGKFTIDNFLIKQKMYDYLNRIAVAGGTVDDMMEVTYDVKNRTRSEIPTYEGGLSKELEFEQVISNSATTDQPLGTIAGRGTLNGKHKGGKIRITNDDTQHAYYMVIASLTPRIMYTQGNAWDTNLKTYEDLHKPAFDQIGFQDLVTDQMASWDTKTNVEGIPTFKSAGKQPAWINYQTEIDRAFGNFASQESEGWMILDRDYDWDEATKSIKDLTTYIDPSKFNGVFAYGARDAQNIWAQFKIDDKAIRKMSANLIPNL